MYFHDRFQHADRGSEGGSELAALVRQQAVLIETMLAALAGISEAAQARGAALEELEGRASMLEAGVDAAYEQLEEMRQVVRELIRRA